MSRKVYAANASAGKAIPMSRFCFTGETKTELKSPGALWYRIRTPLLHESALKICLMLEKVSFIEEKNWHKVPTCP